jgi:hypothetical protein
MEEWKDDGLEGWKCAELHFHRVGNNRFQPPKYAIFQFFWPANLPPA